VGFGSAGVHIPHACAYPIASVKHEYRPPAIPMTIRSCHTAIR
jgi:hydroxyacid-oxoacid transhydrogenase